MGSCIVSARADYSPVTKKPDVTLEMNRAGALKWRLMTRRNIGRYIAVVLDGVVFSCPRVNDEIAGGSTEISGVFTAEQAQDFAHMLVEPQLPVHVRVIEANHGD